MGLTFPDALFGSWIPEPNKENKDRNAHLIIEQDGQPAFPGIWLTTRNAIGVRSSWFGRGEFDGSTIRVKLDIVRGNGTRFGVLNLRWNGSTLVGAVPMFSQNPWTFTRSGSPSPPAPPPLKEATLDNSYSQIQLINSAGPLNPILAGGLATFRSTPFKVRGTARLLGDATISANGWELGFVQVQIREVNFAEYRGRTVKDGSMLIDRTVLTAQPDCYCRDTSGPAPQVWAKPGTIALGQGSLAQPLILATTLSDEINDSSMLIETNAQLTKERKKPVLNYLARVSKAFRFATVLTAKDPKGTWIPLCFIDWWVRWEVTVSPIYSNPDGAGWRASGNQTGWYSTIQPYSTHLPYLSPRILTLPNTECCNDRTRRIALLAETPKTPRHFDSVVANMDWTPFRKT